ncbi:cysteine hydrolase family protein [Klebsiella pneumoniae]
MTAQRVVMVVDMQNGVFATPRLARERCVAQINRLVRAADKVIFIQHDEAAAASKPAAKASPCFLSWSSAAGALYVTKTACDAFYHTSLAQVLDEHDIQQFVICGCATDYCLDTTVKNGASRGYVIVIAEDAHTTADRPAAQAATLIAHYNEVWRTLTIPGNPLQVKPTETILHAWQQN